jgi:hypothetical protein
MRAILGKIQRTAHPGKTIRGHNSDGMNNVTESAEISG